MIRDGQEVVINGMWYIVDGDVDEDEEWVFLIDQNGGSREVRVGEIDHFYD